MTFKPEDIAGEGARDVGEANDLTLLAMTIGSAVAGTRVPMRVVDYAIDNVYVQSMSLLRTGRPAGETKLVKSGCFSYAARRSTHENGQRSGWY